jgi:hypothetical protein
MTRKDYIIIARALRNTYTDACESGQEAIVIEAILKTAFTIASELIEDNPRFNGWHFMDVIRGNKDLNSHPPKGDSRTMEHGRISPERSARVIASAVSLQATKKQLGVRS